MMKDDAFESILSFKNQVVLITGGASGIGRAAVEMYAKSGASVVFADVNVKRAIEVVESAQELMLDVHFIEADVSSAVGCEELVNFAHTKYGKIDILYNNAGIEIAVPMFRMTENDYDKIFNVNVKSVFLCCKAVLPHMMNRRHGVIINTASVAADRAWPNDVVYSATKAAIKLMTQGMAVEYASFGIRVNSVAPGVVDTPMTDFALKDHPCLEIAKREKGLVHPLGRLVRPEEVVRAAMYLSSPDSAFVSGVMLPIDGALLAG
ncbi:MAG: SDR family NAD(P)-dependent oxidoreductase [Acidihalobacter sp.]|uniref:SDR family NAD(P)-dependent oxidoreductase n=1 Tax=Acidihalobacter sp. TaxID=1872108 RepID=UPI00307E7D73